DVMADWPMGDLPKDYPLLESVDVSCFSDSDDNETDAAKKSVGLGYRLRFALLKSRDDRRAKLHLTCAAAGSKEPGGPPRQIGNWRSREEYPPVAELKLGDDLRKLLQTKPASYQVLLCQATHLVQKAVEGQAWPAVSKQMTLQGFQSAGPSSGDFGTHQRYL